MFGLDLATRAYLPLSLVLQPQQRLLDNGAVYDFRRRMFYRILDC
jgi:hypothetical protein